MAENLGALPVRFMDDLMETDVRAASGPYNGLKQTSVGLPKAYPAI
jgi:hypothetical protein